MNTVLEINNLSKNFKRDEILKDINMSVNENRIYGLLGPNGAGKSTLLKIITGVIKKDSGNVMLFGRQWNRKGLRDLGSLIEQPAIYGNLTAYENLEVMCDLLNIPYHRIHEVLDTVGLKTEKLAKHYSLGMKQRLGIALALINNPKLLILDEPTNGLDPIGIKELRGLIKSFPKKGVTVIVSSHLLSEIELMADDIGIIANGVLGFEGAIENYKNELEDLFIDVVNGNGGQQI